MTFDSKNVLLDSKRRPLRIDQGGALSRRAQGGLKGAAFGNEVGELESLRGGKATRVAKRIFKNVSEEDLEVGTQKLKKLNLKKLRALIDEYAPESEREDLYNTLLARRAYILKRVLRETYERIYIKR
jgi:hypothetical protein